MDHADLGLLVLRVVFGLFLAYHGLNKVRGLEGTAGWFSSIGMRWPRVQARLAAGTEIGAGTMLAAGLLTPFAAAGVIGLMIVAIVVAHWRNGFFIFRPGEGWEYCASIAVAAFSIAAIGPGRASLDHALGWTWESWAGAVVAPALGIGGALAQLALSYRPPREAKASA